MVSFYLTASYQYTYGRITNQKNILKPFAKKVWKVSLYSPYLFITRTILITGPHPILQAPPRRIKWQNRIFSLYKYNPQSGGRGLQIVRKNRYYGLTFSMTICRREMGNMDWQCNYDCSRESPSEVAWGKVLCMTVIRHFPYQAISKPSPERSSRRKNLWQRGIRWTGSMAHHE